jgi:hypothetical protein
MWEVLVVMLDETRKKVRVTATRTDDITEEVWVYACTAIIDSPEQRTGVLDRIKNVYEQHEARDARILATIAGLGATATNALNTWEATR